VSLKVLLIVLTTEPLTLEGLTIPLENKDVIAGISLLGEDALVPDRRGDDTDILFGDDNELILLIQSLGNFLG
jgi:hypothetical protein